MQPVSDFWKRFPSAYQDAVRKFDQDGEFTLRLHPGDYRMLNGKLVAQIAPPLHPNARLLYETILNLHPASVLEIGCGSGDNLHNLLVLNPDLEVYGLDLMQEQIDFALKRSPELEDALWQADIAAPLTHPFLRHDVIFSHAVLMHLENKVGAGIENMLQRANKYVVMVENWDSNDGLAHVMAKAAERGWPIEMRDDGAAKAVVVECKR